jgi:hypothetical protein
MFAYACMSWRVLSGGPMSFPDGSTAIFVRDPDSNVIEFNQRLEMLQLRSNDLHGLLRLAVDVQGGIFHKTQL